ncbi:hypothetical protein Aph02nite_77540 [Actinoplanes philippinensis]|uniref:Nucleotidyl transferase AbiEii toxin, Type IV TA system n=1 Tax=Actinoplanes philippinensis TaxID=35752 RepID=A0A1I2HJA1_9ACTN|nr:hypothetical protein [Actinoplanes philippinensis]GIE81804.1 hypothetical protein Aph02nite_77540 [Actinoplanes philippinensis]SFF28947.1 hypothetical protein SAMN05421541_108187 [Actinoplanes philippinensis]
MDQDNAVRPLRDRAELHQTLSLVLRRADPDMSGLRYRLVGTGAALAQAVSLPTGDIDILVARRSDVDALAAALAEFPCLTPPVWLPDARQYYARFAVEGIDVGFSTVEWPVDTDTFECAGSGPWSHYVTIAIGTHLVPTVRLELRLVSELVRNRPDRIRPLVAHLRQQGGDLDLVHRSMQDRGVAPLLRQQIDDQLRGR